MSGTQQILSMEDDGQASANVPSASPPLPDTADVADWMRDEAPTPPRWHGRVVSALCALALAVWTGLFIANHLGDAGTPDQWLGWVPAWSGPVAVLGLIWLATRQKDQTPAEQFAEISHQLHQDATLLELKLSAINAELSIAREFLAAQTRDLDSLGRLAVERLTHSARDLAGLILDNSAQVTAIGSVSVAAVDNMERLRGQLPVLTSAVKDVANTIGTAGRLADDRVTELTRGMERLESLGATGEARIAALRDTLAEAGARGQDLTAHVGAANDSLSGSIARISTFHNSVETQATAHAALLAQMRQSLAALDAESTELVTKANHELSGALARLQTAAVTTGAAIREQGGQAVADIAERLAADSITEIERAMRLEAATLAGRLEQAAAHAAGVAREAGSQLREEITRVEGLVNALDARVADARARAEAQVDNGFARRAALITEALNSSAIDIAKALDCNVADTAWAAYLKGDRGIFTRAAVRLLDGGESKAIARLYHSDDAFRDRVSHYIHDFEGLLREILSTRDGEALGVTLLSSDMGKLYVALAQAIERLRS